MAKEEKDVKDANKVTSALSAECKYDLEVLASLMRCNLQETIKFVLEKFIPVLLVKEMNKKLKGNEVVGEQ